MTRQSIYNSLKNKITEYIMEKSDIWLITILCDRYSGIYSGGTWLAFNCEYSQIPSQVLGSDSEEMWFWSDGIKMYSWLLVGKGTTPDESLDDLYKQYLKRQNETVDN